MKLRELFEAPEGDWFYDAVITIINDCEPFLKEIEKPEKLILWRGMKADAPFMQKSVRKDRRPTDMKAEFHEYYDDWFKEHFGIKFRSEAFFASNSEINAASYGRKYAIFPKGKFSYLWSPEVADLWDYTEIKLKEKINELLINKDPKIIPYVIDGGVGRMPDRVIKRVNGEFYEVFDDKDFEEIGNLNSYIFNEGLKRFAKGTYAREIMISCDNYYALNLSTNESQERWEEIIKKEFLKK